MSATPGLATNIVCLTGPAQNTLDSVAQILAQAGMAAALPPPRDPQLDLARWHQQVSAAAGRAAQPNSQIAPGRLWEQLAGDLFVANMQSGLWGWADSGSTWLLDFWLNFEPNVKFILVCVSPQQMLADALVDTPAKTNASDEAGLQTTVERWLSQHQEMLRFHNRHPQRTLLVAADDCLADPEALLQLCREQWQLPLATPDIQVSRPDTDPVLRYLADQCCRDFPQLDGLQHELAATLTRFGPDADSSSLSSGPSSSPTVEQVIADYRAQQDKHANAIAAVQEELRQVQHSHEQDRNSHEQDRNSHEQDKKSAEQEIKRTQDTLRQSQEENELLLLQLHQVQEELESQVLRQAQSEKTAKELANQSETRHQQINQQVTQQLAQARKDCESLTQAKNTAEQALKAAEQKLKTAEDKLRDSNEENELLLLQLHQVQEELEHYFLRHQDAQNKLQLAENKWQQMMQRNPDYCEYDALELIAAGDGAADDAQTTPHWRVKGLQAGGRSFDELAFHTVMEQDIAGLVFARSPEPTGPLLRWPTVAAAQDELTVIPVADNNNRKQRVETLFDLATADWALMKVLAGILGRELAAPGSPAHQQFTTEQRAALQAGLTRFKDILVGLPATYRFDSLSLKHEQVNPGYEHLWLRCEHVAYGNKSWPAFEFRLACANVTPDSFGTDPRLEIPQETETSPLTGWFAESSDNFGAKLELRFALPNAMDVEVWHQLPEVDQAFMSALISRLPAMLEILRTAGTTLQRPWGQWIDMARELARIFAERTTPAPAQGVPATTVEESESA
ncbi:MAG: hypothetical protein WD071_14950 [Pseudohongiella sp.]|uniref:hypothetical protein n=1 Tax=Pseudohongiella sp. TaxID=1979412 RepID=UPI00349FE827